MTSGFRRLWAAFVVSRFGDGLRGVALPLLAARLSDDPGVVAWVTAAGLLPWLLLSLPAGVVVDRADRGRLLWGTDAVRAVVMGAFTVAVLAGWATIPLLAALAFVLTACQTLSETAFQSIVPSVVPPVQLPRANSRLGAGEIVTERFAGPPLGGILQSRLPA
ncbi:MAG: MFS transporter, partial [Actinobacteria bacterium]|nr:MFS transporter [Actinomycetota bacterium]